MGRWIKEVDGHHINVDCQGQDISRYPSVTFTDEGAMGEYCCYGKVASSELGEPGEAIVNRLRGPAQRNRVTIRTTGFRVCLPTEADAAVMMGVINELEALYGRQLVAVKAAS